MSAVAPSHGASSLEHGGSGSGRGGEVGMTGWDDQIVPALKRRLESESAYLSNRLSASNFPDYLPPPSSSTGGTSFPSGPSRTSDSPEGSAGPSTTSSNKPRQPSNSSSKSPTLPPSHIPRARTKSTPLNAPGTRRPSASNPASIPQNNRRPSKETIPTMNSGLGIQSPDYASYSRRSPNSSNQVLPSAIPFSPSTAPRRPSFNSDSPSSPGGRTKIPTRQRSKTSLGPRPVGQARSPSPIEAASQLPIPSSIPVLKTRSGSSSYSPNLGNDSGQRDSLDLESGGGRVREGFIKNELPPFRMLPEEAMRIAEKGHDINPDDDYNFDLSTEEDDDGGQPSDPSDASTEKRKRAETMKSNGAAKKAGQRINGGSKSTGLVGLGRPTTASSSGKGISGLPRSATGIGYGRPSTSSARKALSNSTGPGNASGSGSGSVRSASNRVNGVSSPGMGSSRSASMNVLSSPSTASTSRLGIAAHLIPPENTYTPPKGANWDDVLLPTVAKRLGVNKVEKQTETGGEEGDLAVEWDRDGKPVKWIKRSEAANQTAVLSHNLTAANQQEPPPTALSTDDQRKPSLRQQRSGNSLRPKISNENMTKQPSALLGPPILDRPLRSKRSGEQLELGNLSSLSPPRTSSGQYTGLSAPNPSATADIIDGYHQGSRSSTSSPAKPRRYHAQSPSRNGRIEHIPGTAWDNSASIAGGTPFDGTNSMRGAGSGIPMTPGTTHMIQENAYRDQYQRMAGSTAPGGANQSHSRAAKTGNDDVSKGCGCTIM